MNFVPAMNTILVNALLVGIGGFAGSVSRYLVGVAVAGTGGWFPVATFVVNVIGAILLGGVLALFSGGGCGETAKHLLAVGFCGGFTTFSTFSAEVFHLLKIHQNLGAAVYAFASLALCVLGVWIGWMICEKILSSVACN